jgi:hypothetical protein
MRYFLPTSYHFHLELNFFLHTLGTITLYWVCGLLVRQTTRILNNTLNNN